MIDGVVFGAELRVGFSSVGVYEGRVVDGYVKESFMDGNELTRTGRRHILKLSQLFFSKLTYFYTLNRYSKNEI